MGATPERLISIDKQLNLKTMALAGTQKFNGTLQVKWQEKELLEQQYVTDYILENINDKTTKIETKKSKIEIEPVISFFNYGGIRTTLPKGEITVGKIFELKSLL